MEIRDSEEVKNMNIRWYKVKYFVLTCLAFIFAARICFAVVWDFKVRRESDIFKYPNALFFKTTSMTVNSEPVLCFISETKDSVHTANSKMKDILAGSGWVIKSSSERSFEFTKEQYCLSVSFVRDEEKMITTVISYKSMGFKCISSANNSDNSGFDIKEVPRYPGSLRVASIEKNEGNVKSLTVIYKTYSSQASVCGFYKNNMKNNWKESEIAKNDNIIYFESKEGSCCIMISEEKGVRFIAIVLYKSI